MASNTAPLQRHRTFAKGVALVVMGLLAGCQTMVPKGPPPGKGPAETAPISQLPTDTERHRIALLVPLTGENAGVGQSIADAANLALLDSGTTKLRVTTYDTALGAANAVNRALADGNRLILGPLLSDDVRAVSSIAAKADVPVLSFSNDISVAGNGTYILGFTPGQSINRVVRYARTQGKSRFAGLVPNGVYGKRASATLISAAEQAGASVVAMQSYDRSTASLSVAIKKLQANQGYDAVLIADSGRFAIQAVPLIRKNGGADAQILGTELWNTENSIAANPVMQGAMFASVSDGMFNQLSAKYKARFGRSPYRLASLGYDAVLLTIRVAGNWTPGTNFPAKALNDPGGFAGVDGAFRFRNGFIAERALEVQQITSGKFATISPAPRKFDE
ncbi:penicillin-binding protein activator [Aquisediminimonas sediminicola]|uniref:penicillin-binding protein activator n=1 Tax=Alteraquisediminimonas sediminicola TaxID=2676787 RepID=UPI001C8E3A70|nr:penicillin-binding protein activator [Aquisediminimonas sediminicola]